MMIGNNELRVNEATMIAAVQLWLNSITGRRLTNGGDVKVIGVYQISDKTFCIKLDGGKKK